MNGPIRAAAPWTRNALRQFAHVYPDLFAQLEERVPDGCHLTLTTGRRPGSWGAVLMRDGVEIQRSADERSLPEACFAAVRGIAA